jgi:hypothetical protein
MFVCGESVETRKSRQKKVFAKYMVKSHMSHNLTKAVGMKKVSQVPYQLPRRQRS